MVNMKGFYGMAFRCVCLASVVCFVAVVPAFAEMSISVGTIERYADGADVPVTIYEDENPGTTVAFSVELYENDEIIWDGTGATDTNGQALIQFSGLAADTRFEGEIWVGDYDDPEASSTFSFSTDSDLERKTAVGCNAGIGVGMGVWTGLILGGFISARKKK
jgi:hypothetical protein